MDRRNHQDEAPEWVVRFYLGLWTLLKVVLIIAFIAALLFLRTRFDKWYYNWLDR